MKIQILITDDMDRQWLQTESGSDLIDGVTLSVPVIMLGNLFPAGNFKKKKK